MMTQKEAFAVLNSFLCSPRCQLQGLSEAQNISNALQALNPEKPVPPPSVDIPPAREKTADQRKVDQVLYDTEKQRTERRKNEDAKAEPANHRSAP